MIPFKLTRENQHKEHTLQEIIVLYLRTRWCIPNNTDVMTGCKWAPNATARKLFIIQNQARGYTNGQPDIILLLPQGKCLLIEIKEPNGRQSQEQKNYQAAAENLGHKYIIWRSLDDAIKFFDNLDKGDNVQTTGVRGYALTPTLPPFKAK